MERCECEEIVEARLAQLPSTPEKAETMEVPSSIDSEPDPEALIGLGTVLILYVALMIL